MLDQKHYLTEDGLRKLTQELDYLRTVRRMEVAERLHNALQEGGEISENAEYEDAKNEQAFVEGEIVRLETILSHAELIQEHPPTDHVGLGNRVTLREKGTKNDEDYYLVGEAEADPAQGRISHKSPMGAAIMGRKVGDEVKVPAPDGDLVFILRAIH
jgi:transcription elongation factor GreA